MHPESQILFMALLVSSNRQIHCVPHCSWRRNVWSIASAPSQIWLHISQTVIYVRLRVCYVSLIVWNRTKGCSSLQQWEVPRLRIAFQYANFLVGVKLYIVFICIQIVIRKFGSRAVLCIGDEWNGYLWKLYTGMGVFKLFPLKFLRAYRREGDQELHNFSH
jgi:hypothetical protein